MKGHGWNFVVIDYSSPNNDFIPTVVSISSGFLCDRVADLIEKLPKDTLVLVASAGYVTVGEKMSPRCIKSFESIGVSNIEKLKSSDSIAVIGVKGAQPKDIKQAVAPKHQGPVTIKRILPTPRIPLSIDATRSTFKEVRNSKTFNTLT